MASFKEFGELVRRTVGKEGLPKLRAMIADNEFNDPFRFFDILAEEARQQQRQHHKEYLAAMGEGLSREERMELATIDIVGELVMAHIQAEADTKSSAMSIGHLVFGDKIEMHWVSPERVREIFDDWIGDFAASLGVEGMTLDDLAVGAEPVLERISKEDRRRRDILDSLNKAVQLSRRLPDKHPD
jgi:hypothetical protein